MAEGGRQVRVFVSSPGDTRFERSRVDRVTERLNGEFQGVARLTTIRWETEFYTAHDTFQSQIPESAQCDIVVAIFRGRLGTELPPGFPPMPDGTPYPSGTAYEVLSGRRPYQATRAPGCLCVPVSALAEHSTRRSRSRRDGSAVGVSQDVL
jgi:hypothetical protein